MKIILTLIALLTGLNAYSYEFADASAPVDLSVHCKPATIKVRIASHRQTALLEAKGSFSVYNPHTAFLLTSSRAAKRAPVSFSADGIVWKETFQNMSSIRVVPQDTQSTLLVDGIEYRGCIEIHAEPNGLLIVNEVDIERYLKSTLFFPFSDEMDREVLEAVAILARTHAHYAMRSHPDALFHVDAKEVGYEGNALILQNLEMYQAIEQTRNMILTFEGASFPATWTKDSAGKTADYARIFQTKIKTPQAVATPIAAKERDQHMWFFEISKKELAQRVFAYTAMHKISDIGLFQDKQSHKIYAVRFKNEAQSQTLDFFTLQKALGNTLLKSNDFVMEIKGDKIYFTGYGEGHGVGMCLLSASFYADKGEKAAQLLNRFFPKTTLTHISN